MFGLLQKSLLNSLNKGQETFIEFQPVKQFIRYRTDSAGFQTQNFKLHKLEYGPTTNVTVSKSDAQKYYRQMKAIREMEVAILQMYNTHDMPGLTHLYTGQEACATGILAALETDDAVITAYRLHGYAYLKGVTMHKIIAELYGRQTGSSKGKGGSMHVYAKPSHFYGGTGIVAGEVPCGAGIALALKQSKKSNICVTVYGDGAANQGQVFETFNIAKLWNLPVLFVCENNGGSRQEITARVTACDKLYTRGHYIPGIWVDGMDVLAVREATLWATKYIRSGKGPIVMELETSYFDGHFAGSKTADVSSQKKSSEGSEVHDRDPITLLRHQISTTGLSSKQEIQEIDNSITKEVEEAVDRATRDPEAYLHERYTDIYMNTPNLVVRGCDVFSKYTSTN